MNNLRIFLQNTEVYIELADNWVPGDSLFAYKSKYELEDRKARAKAFGYKFGLVIKRVKHVCESCNSLQSEEDLSPCKVCGYLIGDCCQAPYNQFSQIDYTLCNSCYERQDR